MKLPLNLNKKTLPSRCSERWLKGIERELWEKREKQEEKAKRVPGLRPKAKGDLSAVDELEEDWESYKQKGATKTRSNSIKIKWSPALKHT